ncbi:hypothetical protein BH10PSE3_BH10PSE3_18970 [soil metagenome]
MLTTRKKLLNSDKLFLSLHILRAFNVSDSIRIHEADPQNPWEPEYLL